MSWNDERVEQLKKMWLEGMSASQIAGELANGITRNAVIGKVHRLGLSGRVKAPTQAQPRPRPQARSHRNSTPRTSAPIVRGNNALAFAPRVHDAVPVQKPIEEVLLPMSERVTIMELKEAMCRWPLGDPATAEFRYCGGKSTIGESYCTYHSRLAYQPAQDRRRERERERRMQRTA
jgi:GcrA cell cycle regulator